MTDYILNAASQEAVNTAMPQGLLLPDKPEYETPKLPMDITELSDEDLMAQYTLLVAWTSFAATQAACASIDERAANRAADEAENQVFGAGAPKGSTVALAKARAASDERVVKLRNEAERAHHYRKFVETLRDNMDRSYALFSRELTRRTSINPQIRKDRYTT